MHPIFLNALPLYNSECPDVTNHSSPHTSLTFAMNFTMDKAKIPYGKIIRQEIQLVLDPKTKSHLPWVSFASLSGGRNDKKLFFAKWEEDKRYDGSKMISNLPINENFKALARIYGDLGNGKFVTFDCPLKDVTTNLWYCKSKQNIRSDKVCDGKEDCWDKSDEDAKLCRGSNNKLIQISKCVNITILVLGYIVSAAYFWFATSKTQWSEVDGGIMTSDDTNTLTDKDTETFNALFEVCKKFEDWNNARVGKGPTKEDFSKIIEKYKPFMKLPKMIKPVDIK